MSTLASRPGWTVKARAITGTRVAVPAGIGALVAISLLLRTTELGIGFWIDEGLSVGIADRPLSDIPFALREDGSPPLYYMLLHFWLDIAGRSEAGVRGLSLLFALLAIPAGFWAGRQIWGTLRAGWFSAVLMAFNPFLAQYAQEARMYSLVALLAIPAGFWAGRQIWGTLRAGWFAAVLMAFNPFLAQYAQEARMYSLVALLAIPATACFIKAYALDTANRRPWIVGFAISEAIALYAHNWPIFFAIAAGLAFLVLLALSEDRRRLFLDGLLGFGGAVVLYLPWVPTTLYQAAHTGAPWSDAPALSALTSVPGTLLGRMPEIVLLICAGAGVIALVKFQNGRLGERGRAAACLAIIAVLTPTIAWATARTLLFSTGAASCAHMITTSARPTIPRRLAFARPPAASSRNGGSATAR
jgi:uncharacterized membrane protein